jgi:H+/gluconate symporter-like permease
MKNFIYGIIVGIVITFLFIMLGGGKLFEKAGRKTEQFKQSVIERIEKTGEKAKEGIEEMAK